MKDFLCTMGGVVATLSLIAFLIGIIACFFHSSRKKGLKIILVSLITFVIGFSTCAATFSMSMH